MFSQNIEPNLAYSLFKTSHHYAKGLKGKTINFLGFDIGLTDLKN